MSDPAAKEQPQVLPYAYPLDDFYAQQNMTLPPIESVAGELVPQPYRSLLVHDDDMTPTLEGFHGGRIHLTVIRRQERGDFYYREVVLSRDTDDAPVEFGAIKITLNLFPRTARQDILSERLPLGRILAERKIRHFSRPKAFLKIHSDEFINNALQLTGDHTLYGRRNTLWSPDKKALAEIVEILPIEPRV
jgi:chorismate-pyruvate lyase